MSGPRREASGMSAGSGIARMSFIGDDRTVQLREMDKDISGNSFLVPDGAVLFPGPGFFIQGAPAIPGLPL